MSKFIKLTTEDIVRHWDIVSFAYEQTSFLTEKANLGKMLQNVLFELLAGERECWALFNVVDNEIKFKVIIGIRTMSAKNNIEPVKSMIIGPVYGFEAATMEEKMLIFDKLKQIKKNKGFDSSYLYTNIPIACNVAEKVGMHLAAKVYTDKQYGGKEDG